MPGQVKILNSQKLAAKIEPIIENNIKTYKVFFK